MRTLTSFILGLIAIAGVVALGIFVGSNTQSGGWHFLGYAFSANAGWITAAAAVLGFLVALLLLLPGRVAAGWRGRALRREGLRLQQDLESLRLQHQQLQAERARLQTEHQQVVAERDRLRSQVAARPAGTARPQPAPAATLQRPDTGTSVAPAGGGYGQQQPMEQPSTAHAGRAPAQRLGPAG